MVDNANNGSDRVNAAKNCCNRRLSIVDVQLSDVCDNLRKSKLRFLDDVVRHDDVESLFKWIQTVPAVEILLANQKQGLRQHSFRENHEPLWSSFVKVAPELVLHLAEVMLSTRSVSYMRQFAEETKYTTGCSFTRTHRLAENGMVLRILSRNLWELKYLIKWLGLSKSDLASVGVPWPRSMK